MAPHQNLDPNSKGSRYPKKVPPWKDTTVNEVEEVRAAIKDGLDPNIHWSEEDLVIPQPKSGCVIPPYVEDSETWPHFNTPLHRAIRFSDFESAQLLLQHGADVNLYNSIGRTALHEAVWNHDHDAIRFLLAHNADVNKSTVAACVRYEDDERDIHGFEGDLCILRALSTSDLTSFRLLAEAAAELHPASQGPWTALDLALLSGDRQIVEYLQTRGIKLPARLPALETWTENTHRDPSRDLLAFSSTSDILPPSDLYPAYCYALANIQGHTSECDVDSLIQGFFKALQETAGQTQHRTGSKMCASCQAFQSGFQDVDERQTQYKVTLHQSRQDLNDSAARGCPLCRIVADALDHEEGRLESNPKSSGQQATQSKDVAQPILLWVEITPPKKLSMSYLWVSWGDLRIHLDVARADDDFILTPEDEKEPDTSTGSTSAMEMAKTWLRTCKDDGSHGKCQEAYRNRQNTGALPRRLLRVGGPDDNPRLVQVQDIRVPYCALSYCWGTKDFFMTTRANLSQNMEEIPRESFPIIMQDAMSVTRSLGYDYIWIDALCIVQDDEKDWAHEASIMGSVYSNAELTISTLVAGDCHTGLFQPRSLRVVRPVILDIWQPRSERISHRSWAVFAEWAQEHLCIHGPVHSRGWTLQEQLLSTRILYFGDGILHWECLHDYMAEADPGGDNRRSYNYRADLAKRSETKQAIQGALSLDRNSSAIPQGASQPFELWKQQAEDFTCRSLSKSSDRLPAFASISASLAGAAGNSLLCGIWNGDKLLESLCWNVVKPSSSPKSLSMPSWTWGATVGEVSFHLVSRTGRGNVPILTGATVVSVDAQANEAMSEVYGSITLKSDLCHKGPLRSSFFEAEEHEAEGMWLDLLCDTESCVFLDSNIDTIEDVYAISVLSFPEGPPHEGYGYPRWPGGRGPTTLKLLLQRVGNESNKFRRIGIGIQPGITSESRRKGGDGEEMTPLKWLMTDEEVFENHEFALI
ncbi:hypothetical protein NM208_g978 [Fusarium decemcellulare]|uniref:Uncharacterized protein n=1 Tax=Fusarium decemcellulare TaxID=57161 RepID=A0ACC1SXH4_9HYPO|nr:hypothetical protein NM208_g978 [Fusarium decemcellulare]